MRYLGVFIVQSRLLKCFWTM